MNVGTKMTAAGAFAHIRTLEQVVEDFEKRYGSGKMESHSTHDPVLEWTIKAPNVKEAIRRACDGRREDGKMFQMESCVRTSSKLAFRDHLVLMHDAIEDIITSGEVEAFDTLYDLVREAKPWGIGELSVYNVTARIGAWKGVRPIIYVYLHAGPLKGWKALTGSGKNPYRILVAELPEPLRHLAPHRTEDLFCEYRDLLNPGMLQ